MSMNHHCSTQTTMFNFMRNVSSTTSKIKIMLSIPYDLRNKNKIINMK